MSDVENILSRLGGTRKAAQLLGCPPSTVHGWKRAGAIPANRLLEIEKKTGIPREQLRPDLYRNPETDRSPERRQSDLRPFPEQAA